MLLAVCGLCCGTSLAQERVINITGATLLENYVRSAASTRDFIDVDGNGICGSCSPSGLQQLAPGVWTVQYRIIGSVNGFQELLWFGGQARGCSTQFFDTGDDNNACGPTLQNTDPFVIPPVKVTGVGPSGSPYTCQYQTIGYWNRVQYVLGGAQIPGIYDAANAGGLPARTTTDGNYFTRLSDSSPGTGVQMDLAVLDVPGAWAVRINGAGQYDKAPTEPGYGQVPYRSRDKNTGAPVGSSVLQGGLDNRLPALFNNRNFNPPATADCNTLFDTAVFFAPIATVTNLGTGVREMKATELQHLFTTGRTKTGENLVAVTRDVGSGTRNGYYNSIGLDPSWGNGDNIGRISTATANNRLGSAFSPTNKGGNSGVEETARNHRLAIGYAGGERGVTGGSSGSWLTSGALEIIAVQNDHLGGTEYSRPTTAEITSFDANGYVIGGPSAFVSVGDPRAEPVSLGGEGRSTPRMANPAAAAYLNNYLASLAAFVAVPSDPENFGQPAEFAATQFILTGALRNRIRVNPGRVLEPNPTYSPSVEAYTLANSVYNNPLFASFNTTTAGRVPQRNTGTVYSDGVAGGANYISQGGSPVTYGTPLTRRNLIAGDFNGDGLRNLDDACHMVTAYLSRNGGPAWVASTGSGIIAGEPGSDAIIEVLGDFNGDGSFTIADLRYWADGLAMTGPGACKPGLLNRPAGFAALDACFGGTNNIFSTTLATGAAYKMGDSAGDVAGLPGVVPAPGWAPIAADGRVDAKDIDYVFGVLRTAGGSASAPFALGSVDWQNELTKAALSDLSADINGDLKIDLADVCRIVVDILARSSAT
jgi:hypothetical protein